MSERGRELKKRKKTCERRGELRGKKGERRTEKMNFIIGEICQSER